MDAEEELPACFALVHPGLETITADEITRDLGGSVKKSHRGLVVFRAPYIDSDILKLRTTEDVYLLAWGTDSLTYKAADLDQIRRWTSRDADWDQLMKLHQTIRPKLKGRPTYRLITQMSGTHGYRRVDARDALAEGLSRVIPKSWKPAEENAFLEIWLTIRGATAVCGVRLSDKTMRHRTYKVEHIPASLRPTVAAAMVRLAGAAPGHIVVDPMCGAGTILAEQIELSRLRKAGMIYTWGGDVEWNAVRTTTINLRKVGPCLIAQWDARRLPLGTESVDRIVCNPPFGVQLSSPEEITSLYDRMIPEWDRVLRPLGRVVVLVAEDEPLRNAIKKVKWQPRRKFNVQILGQDAVISVWEKGDKP
jgi:23S rRNA G2445 N2-methylase RlmL